LVITIKKMTTYYRNDLDPKNGISPIIDTLGGDDVIHIFIHSLTSLGDLAESFGKRNAVPGELLVRVAPTKIIAYKDVTGR